MLEPHAPFLFSECCFSLTNRSLNKYLYITIIVTFSNILLVLLILNSIRDSIISYNDVVISWNGPHFILSLIILLLFVYISKKINLKLFDDKN